MNQHWEFHSEIVGEKQDLFYILHGMQRSAIGMVHWKISGLGIRSLNLFFNLLLWIWFNVFLGSLMFSKRVILCFMEFSRVLYIYLRLGFSWLIISLTYVLSYKHTFQSLVIMECFGVSYLGITAQDFKAQSKSTGNFCCKKPIGDSPFFQH